MCPSATDASELKFVQLLESIGALSKADSKKAKSHSNNYQNSTVAPVDHEYDNEAIQQEDEEEYEDKSSATAGGRCGGIISAVAKVMFFLPSP